MHCFLLILKFLLWLQIISILQASTSTCCLQQERVALLELKAHLLSLDLYSSVKLRSWGEEGGNCCSWNRVKCNPMQHVTQLSLDWVLPFEFFVLNVSLFEPFKELSSLNLSYNGITGLVGLQGANKSTNLRNLEIFDFGFNSIETSGELEHLVGSLTSLKTLVLGYNDLEQSFATKVLLNLKQLQVLDLQFTTSTSGMDRLFPSVANLKDLQVLDLSWNNMSESPPEQLGDLCELRNLQQLYLSALSISGNLPGCFGNLTSLRILDVSDNNLSGDLSSIIPNLKSLEAVSISDNSFSGEFSLNSLCNHSNLGVLILSNNCLHVQIDGSLHLPSFQPKILGLSNCNLKMQSRSFLQFLSHQRNLQSLDISHNGLVGPFPTWLLQNNSNIETLMMQNNSFGGVLCLPKDEIEHPSLTGLDISENDLYGSFPEDFGILFPSLGSLNASRNHFQGKIPASLGNLAELELLDLSNNNFSGQVPRRIYTNCHSLVDLRLSTNSLQGEIIPSHMNLTQLMVLHLDGNRFTGTIEDRALESLSSISHLDISNNEVTGGIPRGIGNVSFLRIFSISDNQFKGPIPIELCNLHQLLYLDLSNNELTGVIPSCNYSNLLLSGLLLNNNFLSGSIPNTLSFSSRLVVLDLSGNRLSGGIPLWIGNLSHLDILLLGHNSLGGQLPETLCNLKQINIIDLSSNEISGGILPCFANMSFGVVQSLDAVLPGSSFGVIQLSDKLYPGKLFMHLNREVVTLLTKGRYDDFNGDILNIMSVLDLSSNRLTGEIPRGLGQLDKLQALNLSHNELSGSIPTSFSMMKSIESLDLSYNNLSGTVPSELAQLTFIEIFNVSYNNLSGTVPEAGQFASFDERNYMRNPLLCGFVGKSCASTTPKDASPELREDDGSTYTDGFDWEIFSWSFVMSSVTLFLCINMVLLINPEWRRAWFAFSDYHILWWL